MRPVILAIESSCDETSASVIRNGKVLNNIIASQAVHQKYGGVVPELASRAHQQNIVMVVKEAMERSGVERTDLDAIGFTRGPGLIGSLLVGVSFAKGMALGLGVPLIEVNHMQAHVLAHFIDEPTPRFPFLCLTVSGGHTQIVLVRDYLDMEVIGQTQDDAVGEAFDKAAKQLANQVQIPGFRAGKAPRPLIEKQLGRHRHPDLRRSCDDVDHGIGHPLGWQHGGPGRLYILEATAAAGRPPASLAPAARW